MLEGVALCSPYAQGDLDNLCGLYAAINAICLVSAPLHPLRQSQVDRLLAVGIEYLHRRNWLSAAIIRGMELERQRALTQHLAMEAERITDLKFSNAQLFPDRPINSKDAVLSLIEKSIGSGSALVLCFEKTLWHYTVISSLSSSRIYLFDSYGFKWIERRSFEICGSPVKARHRLPLDSIIEVGCRRAPETLSPGF